LHVLLHGQNKPAISITIVAFTPKIFDEWTKYIQVSHLARCCLHAESIPSCPATFRPFVFKTLSSNS